MKRLIAALGLMLLASPAFATTVSTSMLLVPANIQTAGCNVVNVGKKPLTITTSIISLAGTVLFSPAAFAVAPGTGTFATTTPILDQYLYCSFQFSGGSAKDVRGSLEVLDSTTSAPLATLPAS